MNPRLDPSVDHYQVLGLGPDATADEIKRAYRRLARRYHPDSTGGDKAKEAKFKEISAAYDVLGDPDERARYDALRAGGATAGDFGGAASGFWDLGDLFSQVFSGAGADGGRVEYRVYSDGSPVSGGFEGAFGGGFSGDTPFDVPPGRSRGRRGRRPAARPASERTVHTSDGAALIQRRDDVYSDVRLTVDEAILGTVKEVSTLTGKAKVRIPPGTSSGVKLRLRGKGARGSGGAQGDHRGDHFVTVQIDVPRDIDDEARRLLVQFMRRTRDREGDK